MNEVIVKCLYCGTDNHFFPPRIVEIVCINCGKSLHLVSYDEQLSHDRKKHDENEVQK